MTLLSGKHKEIEINETRVRVVESGTSMERIEFLKKLLEHNGYEVLSEQEPKKEETDPDTWVIGVTNIIFNPVVAVYNRILRTFEGKHVTADYWNQKTNKTEPNYWDLKKKDY
jgi:hypothetical protein